MKKQLYFLFLYGISCSEPNVVDNKAQAIAPSKSTEEMKLSKIDQLILQANTTLRFGTNSICTFLDNGEENISYLDSDSQTIITFDSDSGEILDQIPLEIEGPNGVGNIGYVSAHYHHGPDSIFLFNRQTSPLYLINGKGEIIKTYKVTDYSGSTNFPVPNSSTMSPMHIWNNSLLMSCGIQNYEEDFTGYPSLLKLDLKNGKIDYLTTLPEIYSKAFWGAYFKYDPSVALNSDNNKVIISYPVDHQVYEIDLTDGREEKYIIRSDFIQEINPYQDDPAYFTSRNPNERDEKENVHALSTSEYRGLIYDHWRNIFYRIAILRPSRDQVLKGDKKFSFSIITFNENFEKVGESPFTTSTHDPSSIFLTKEGLAIFRKDLYLQNEDLFIFDLFIPRNIGEDPEK
ncbi:DUF4221 family protein [Algoriphagus namhaensis]